MTKDLVERVARALCTGTDPDSVSPYSGDVLWQCREPEAIAAIAAVAEWIGPEYCVTRGNLLNQLEGKK